MSCRRCSYCRERPCSRCATPPLTVGGRTLPLMVMDYVGTVNTYLATAYLRRLGVSVTSVRLLPILLAALA